MLILLETDWFEQLSRQVSDVLGIPWTLKGEWEGSVGLPLHVIGGWRIWRTRLGGRDVLLVLDQEPDLTPIKRLDVRLRSVSDRSDMGVVYSRPDVPYYHRIRMVKAGISFVVAGSHVNLPEWGAEVRNRKMKALGPQQPRGISTASQYLLLRMLGRIGQDAGFSMKELVGPYSAMTVSRAVREWEAYGWILPRTSWKRGKINWSASPRTIWESAFPVLKNPVLERQWVHADPALQASGVLSGESALARLTRISDPPNPVWAIPKREWATLRRNLELLPYAEADAIRVEVWMYEPSFDPNSPTVDLLSLFVSLRDEQDARIRESLDQLRRMLPW